MTVTTRSEQRIGRRSRGGSLLSAGGVLAALAAFASASCCVLPLAFVALGLGGSWLSMFDTALAYRMELMVAALAMVGLAWAVVLRRRYLRRGACDDTCVRTAPLTIAALMTAKVLIVGAWAVTEYQGAVTQWLLAVR